MRTLFLRCFVISVAISALAQQRVEYRASWLFPPDKDLLAAAQLGFVRKDDIPLKHVYERAGANLTLPERMTMCRDKVELGAGGWSMHVGRPARTHGAETSCRRP